MAFADKDTEVTAPATTRTEVVTLVFERVLPLGKRLHALLPDGAPTLEDLAVGDEPLRVIGRKLVTEGGRARTVYGAVPQATVNAGWPGASRSLKAHLGTIIDNMVWAE